MSGDDLRAFINLLWLVLVVMPQLFGVLCGRLATRQSERVCRLIARGALLWAAGKTEHVLLRRFHIGSRLVVVAQLHRKARDWAGCATIGSLTVGSALGLTYWQENDVVVGCLALGCWCGVALVSWQLVRFHRWRVSESLKLAETLEGGG